MKITTKIMLLLMTVAGGPARSETMIATEKLAEGTRSVTFAVAAGPGAVQVLPHIMVSGPVTTDFLILNTGSAAASVSLSFFDDNGQPMIVNFPELKAAGEGLSSRAPIPPGSSIFIEAGDVNAPTRGGSAFITSDPGISVSALFRSKTSDGLFYEAAVSSSAGSTRFIIPFDATTFPGNGAQVSTGIAVANLDSATTTTLACTARDSAGATIANAVIVPPIPPLGHWAGANFPALSGKHGQLDCTSATKVGAIGLRFLGQDAFTALPVIQATASSVTPNPPTNGVSVIGKWSTTGPDFLIFYDGGTVDTYTTLNEYVPRKGTFQITGNTIVVNWSSWLGIAAEQENIRIVQSGSTTTLVRDPNIAYSRD